MPWNRKNKKEKEMDHFLLFRRGGGVTPPPLLKRKVEEFPSPGGPVKPPALDVLPIPWLQEVNPYFPLIRKAGNILAESESSSKILFSLPSGSAYEGSEGPGKGIENILAFRMRGENSWALKPWNRRTSRRWSC